MLEKKWKILREYSKISKKEIIKVDWEEIVFYLKEELLVYVEFKGYEEVIV